MTRSCLTPALVLLVLSVAASARAQVVRVGPKVVARPMASVGGTASVTASPGSTTFKPLAHGAISTATNSIVLTSKLALSGVANSVTLWGYFSSTSALTNGSGGTIPSSALFGQCTTGTPTSFTAFTASDSSGFGVGSSLLIWRTTGLGTLSTGRTDTLSLEINLGSVPQTPAGTYTGTLNFLIEVL